MSVPNITKTRLLLAAGVLGAALFLSGCVAFTGPITLSQQDVIGSVRVSFTVCATADPSNHPGCDEPSNSGNQPGSPSKYQVLLGFRVPKGTKPPATFQSTSGEPLTFTRSPSYEQQLESFQTAGANEQWVGYISNVYSYDQGPNGTPAKRAGFDVDFGLPEGIHGHPFPGPFTARPVVGGRVASGTAGSGSSSDPDRPVSCGDNLYGGSFFANTACIDSPDKSGSLNHFSLGTRDLGIGGTQTVAAPGKEAKVPFTARWSGSADPNARFALTSRSSFRRTPVTLSKTTLTPGANSTEDITASLTVPKKAPAGKYLVALLAELPNGQKRGSLAVLRVRDTIPPVARGLDLVPDAFAPRGAPSSIAVAHGARVKYRLSENATVRFRVQRRVCRRGKCRYRTLKGGFRHKGKKGANRFRFTGFLRHRRLAPGRYRLVGVPVDKAKNRGRAARARFRILP